MLSSVTPKTGRRDRAGPIVAGRVPFDVDQRSLYLEFELLGVRREARMIGGPATASQSAKLAVHLPQELRYPLAIKIGLGIECPVQVVDPDRQLRHHATDLAPLHVPKAAWVRMLAHLFAEAAILGTTRGRNQRGSDQKDH